MTGLWRNRTGMLACGGWLVALAVWFGAMPCGGETNQAEQRAPGLIVEATNQTRTVTTSNAVPESGRTLKRVAIIHIEGMIEPALSYVVRRGVREAVASGAEALLLEIDTLGGRLDSTQEIVDSVAEFPHQEEIFALVDKKAISAGAFIATSAREIFMTPGSLIGASAPIVIGHDLGETEESKMISFVRGMIRAVAERQGHNPQVLEAMVDRSIELKIGDKVISAKGDLLTLTASEAVAEFGDPPRPLLARAIVDDRTALFARIGATQAELIDIRETGFEVLARWIVLISPILLLAGIVGFYVEMNTPGIGLPALGAGICFALVFFGHYIAGLSGHETAVLFVAGAALVLLEVLVMPGTVLPAILGVGMMFGALVWTLADGSPLDGGLPDVRDLGWAMVKVTFSMVGAGVAIVFLGSALPLAPGVRRRLVLDRAIEGGEMVAGLRVGDVGTTLTVLRPGGRGQFGDRLEDVVSIGELIEAGVDVKVVEIEGNRVFVERTGP